MTLSAGTWLGLVLLVAPQAAAAVYMVGLVLGWWTFP